MEIDIGICKPYGTVGKSGGEYKIKYDDAYDIDGTYGEFQVPDLLRVISRMRSRPDHEDRHKDGKDGDNRYPWLLGQVFPDSVKCCR